MRKQVLIGMMLLTLGAGLIGCGKSETNKTENNTTTVAGGGQVADASTEAKKEEAKVDTSDWVYCSIDPTGNVYYPKYYLGSTDIGTYLYNSKEVKNQEIPYFIVIEGGYEKELNENTYDDVFNNFLKHIGTTYYISFINTPTDLLRNVKVKCISKETCKANGHDAFKYTAKTTEAINGKECYIYGYLASTPKASFTVYGIITDDSQSDALKKEVQTDVDAIMNTFETK